MQVDLKITGNQYTYMTTIYNAVSQLCRTGIVTRSDIHLQVYCILQVPSNMVVLKVRPSYWLAGCEIGWTIFTFAQAGAKNYQMM
jgi:ACS family pantothenate transporter-like MFS transporter